MMRKPTSRACWSKWRGEEIIIAKAGKVIARLVPLEAPPKKRQLGLLKGKLNVPDNFDAPLPDDELRLFEGR